MKYFFELLESFSKLKKRKLKILTEQDKTNSSQGYSQEEIAAAQQAVSNAVESVKSKGLATNKDNPISINVEGKKPVYMYGVAGENNAITHVNIFITGEKGFSKLADPMDPEVYSKFIPAEGATTDSANSQETPENPQAASVGNQAPTNITPVPQVPLTEAESIMRQHGGISEEQAKKIVENSEASRLHIYNLDTKGNKQYSGSSMKFMESMLLTSKREEKLRKINSLLLNVYRKYKYDKIDRGEGLSPKDRKDQMYLTMVDLLNTDGTLNTNVVKKINEYVEKMHPKHYKDQRQSLEKTKVDLNKLLNEIVAVKVTDIERANIHDRGGRFMLHYYFGKANEGGSAKSMLGRMLSGLRLLDDIDDSGLFKELGIEKITGDELVSFSEIQKKLGEIFDPKTPEKKDIDEKTIRANILEKGEFFKDTFQFNSDGTIGIKLGNKIYVISEPKHTNHITSLMHYINSHTNKQNRIKVRNIDAELSHGVIAGTRGVLLEELLVLAGKSRLIATLEEGLGELKKKGTKSGLGMMYSDAEKIAAYENKIKSAKKDFKNFLKKSNYKKKIAIMSTTREAWAKALSDGACDEDLHFLGSACEELLKDDGRYLIAAASIVNRELIESADFILHMGTDVGTSKKSDVMLVSRAKKDSEGKFPPKVDTYGNTLEAVKASDVKAEHPDIEQLIEDGIISENDYLYVSNISFKHYIAKLINQNIGFTGGNSATGSVLEAFQNSIKEGIENSWIGLDHIKPEGKDDKDIEKTYQKEINEDAKQMRDLMEDINGIKGSKRGTVYASIENHLKAKYGNHGVEDVMGNIATYAEEANNAGLSEIDQKNAEKQLNSLIGAAVPMLHMNHLLRSTDKDEQRRGRNLLVSHLYACGYSIDRNIMSSNRVLHEDMIMDYQFSQNGIVKDFAKAIKGEKNDFDLTYRQKDIGYYQFIGPEPDRETYGELKFDPAKNSWTIRYTKNYLELKLKFEQDREAREIEEENSGIREKGSRTPKTIKKKTYETKRSRGSESGTHETAQVESTLISTLITTQTKLLETLLNLQKHRVTNFK